MGRGRVALQLFLSNVSVVGVELAGERYGLAVAALERLTHRCAHEFEIARKGNNGEIIRIRRRHEGPEGAFCEELRGNLFEVTPNEAACSASLVFLHVCLPSAVWPEVCRLLSKLRDGCRILMYDDLMKIWANGQREDGSFPFMDLGELQLACTWGRHHRFHCYERARISSDSTDAGGGGTGVQDTPRK